MEVFGTSVLQSVVWAMTDVDRWVRCNAAGWQDCDGDGGTGAAECKEEMGTALACAVPVPLLALFTHRSRSDAHMQ